MSRKRKPLPLLEDIEITGIAAEGVAIARPEGERVVFIPYGAPGDRVDVQVRRQKRTWAEGEIVRMIRPSKLRVEPRCESFGICGGCKWQHLPYDAQLGYKQQQVVDALDRIGHLEHPPVQPILGSKEIYGYRNKMEYTFSNKRWLTREQIESGYVPETRDGAGFHIPGAFDKVLDINCCHLANDLSNRLRNHIRDLAIARSFSFYDLKGNQGLMRTLMVRTASTGQTMALMAFGEDNPDAIREVMTSVAEAFPELTSLLYTINTKANDTLNDLEIITFAGQPWIEERMEELSFRVGPKSFYQTNSRQAYRLYSVVREEAALTGNENVYDLYTGTGTIACFLARGCRRVTGIEYVEDAVRDARVNAQINGLDNTSFHAGDMKDVFNAEFISRHGQPDVVVVDPPRAGMHADVVATLLKAAPKRIVYVSCNPATQARDLALLTSEGAYTIRSVRPVDMFPHTAHVENVVTLDRC